jgi:hypothetical protein
MPREFEICFNESIKILKNDATDFLYDACITEHYSLYY